MGPFSNVIMTKFSILGSISRPPIYGIPEVVRVIKARLLGGSWDLVATHNWAYNPTCSLLLAFSSLYVGFLSQESERLPQLEQHIPTLASALCWS